MFVSTLLFCVVAIVPASPQGEAELKTNTRAVSPVETGGDQPELIYFYDDLSSEAPETRAAIKMATESGFRIREVSARRFPRLAKAFRVLTFPALIMRRGNRMESRHNGRITFPRIREMFARARERRMKRREHVREMLAERFQTPPRIDSPPTLPSYIHTSGNSDIDRRQPKSPSSRQPDRPATSGLTSIPKPLDRNGRFPVAHTPSDSERLAFNATVRLRVSDPGGTSHGTGTIIHSIGNDALVLTCGHIFRDSKGRGRIEADVNFASGFQSVPGQLVSYDAKAHDIALLVIKTPNPVKAVPLAPILNRQSTNAPVFTIGCDRGNTPTIRRSHYKRRGIYDGVEKYDVFGRPIDGRSGGGLFNESGQLIGVCNAAAVHIDEGIYSGLATIYHQLRVSHLSQLFGQRSSGTRLAKTADQPSRFSRGTRPNGVLGNLAPPQFASSGMSFDAGNRPTPVKLVPVSMATPSADRKQATEADGFREVRTGRTNQTMDMAVPRIQALPASLIIR